MELELIEFGLRETVEQAIKICATRAHSKGLELVCSSGCRSAGQGAQRPDAAAADSHQSGRQRHQVHRIPARRSSPASRRLAITGVVRFEVSDTGIGIPPD